MNNEQTETQQPPSSLFYFTSLESFEKWYELLLALDQLKARESNRENLPHV